MVKLIIFVYCNPKICVGLVKLLQLKNQFSGHLLAHKIPTTAICLRFLQTVFPAKVFELIVTETKLYAMEDNADKESKIPTGLTRMASQANRQSKSRKLSRECKFWWESLCVSHRSGATVATGMKSSQPCTSQRLQSLPMEPILGYFAVHASQQQQEFHCIQEIQPVPCKTCDNYWQRALVCWAIASIQRLHCKNCQWKSKKKSEQSGRIVLRLC